MINEMRGLSRGLSPAYPRICRDRSAYVPLGRPVQREKMGTPSRGTLAGRPMGCRCRDRDPFPPSRAGVCDLWPRRLPATRGEFQMFTFYPNTSAHIRARDVR
jgi:hypothetical protein